MKRVKGSILIDFVKTIKASKSQGYEKYLTEEDRNLFSQRLLPSAWYPFETFKHVFQGVFEILAKKDLEAVRKWGRFYGEAIVSNLYKGIIREGHPMDSLLKYPTYLRNMFDFGKVEVKELGPAEALVTVMDFDPAFVPFYYILFGWLERTLEMCGAKNIQSEILTATWQGAPQTQIKFSWKL
jgi:uncharacterized protein (TIGR02265 family)